MPLSARTGGVEAAEAGRGRASSRRLPAAGHPGSEDITPTLPLPRSQCGADFPDQQLQEIGLVNGATHDLLPCTVSGAVETPAAALIILRRRRPVNSVGAPLLSPVPDRGR